MITRLSGIEAGVAEREKALSPVHRGPRLRHRRSERQRGREGSTQASFTRLLPCRGLEQDYVERLSDVRMARNGSDVLVDIPSASSAELDAAREAVKLIQARGFGRGQDVAADLENPHSGRQPLTAHPSGRRPRRPHLCQGSLIRMLRKNLVRQAPEDERRDRAGARRSLPPCSAMPPPAALARPGGP